MSATPIAYADEIQLPPSYSQDYEASIRYWADRYSAPAEQMIAVIKCESKFNVNAVGDHGHSFGLVQIFLPAHPNITKKQALDPDFAVEYLASHWFSDHWTCQRLLGFDSS